MKDIESMNTEDAKQALDELLTVASHLAKRFNLSGYALFLSGTTASQAFAMGRKQAEEFISYLNEALEKSQGLPETLTARQAFVLGLVGELNEHVEVIKGGDLDRILSAEDCAGHA